MSTATVNRVNGADLASAPRTVTAGAPRLPAEFTRRFLVVS
jgi:hypothetical protein